MGSGSWVVFDWVESVVIDMWMTQARVGKAVLCVGNDGGWFYQDDFQNEMSPVFHGQEATVELAKRAAERIYKIRHSR